MSGSNGNEHSANNESLEMILEASWRKARDEEEASDEASDE